jgi:hypothetical protein
MADPELTMLARVELLCVVLDQVEERGDWPPATIAELRRLADRVAGIHDAAEASLDGLAAVNRDGDAWPQFPRSRPGSLNSRDHWAERQYAQHAALAHAILADQPPSPRPEVPPNTLGQPVPHPVPQPWRSRPLTDEPHPWRR